MLQILMIQNEENHQIFSYQETIFKDSDIPPIDPERPDITPNSPEFQKIVNQRRSDKRKSLFGHNIITGSDSKSFIISAPGQKDSNGAYIGDVFLCILGSLLNPCSSFITDPSISNLKLDVCQPPSTALIS
ncbi:hypothetical protein RF11_06074 [Thelohanellus kitauei]|uniref:Uncharacterized protein n=1 Tax=Thelohanellus kitauei TaxID=669202 RepID=A0A0C2N454_THEKT|nr:hypothetical protein RF11_06074 [Thelohanellus kitauei]